LCVGTLAKNLHRKELADRDRFLGKNKVDLAERKQYKNGERYVMRSFYYSPNIIRMIKLRRMRVSGREAPRGAMRHAF